VLELAAEVEQSKIYRSSNESCILSMGRIPVSAIKNSNSINAIAWKVLEELDESAFILNL
jgi:selenophosphate synthase